MSHVARVQLISVAQYLSLSLSIYIYIYIYIYSTQPYVAFIFEFDRIHLYLNEKLTEYWPLKKCI